MMRGSEWKQTKLIHNDFRYGKLLAETVEYVIADETGTQSV